MQPLHSRTPPPPGTSTRAHLEASLLAQEGQGFAGLGTHTQPLVLIVQADADLRRYLMRWVGALVAARSRAALQVGAVADAEEALALIRSRDVRLLVSDHAAALASGEALPDVLAEDAGLRHIPVVLLAEREHAARSLERRAATAALPRRVLRKPLGRNALATAIHALLPSC